MAPGDHNGKAANHASPRGEHNNVDCMNPSGYGVDPRTGERYLLTCRRLSCPPCARRKAAATTRAIRLSKPNAMVTLTKTGTTWKQTHARMTRFNREMRNRVGAPAWQCCWHVHVNDSDFDPGQTHIHAVARCTQVNSATVQEVAARVGMGQVVQVQTIEAKGEGYGMHPVLDTKGLSHAEAAEQIDNYRAANGGQLFHTTGQFWRDAKGEPCTVKEARRASARFRP